MTRMKLGIALDCLGLPFRQALLSATREGAAAIQMQVTREIHPQKLSQTGRREVAHHIRSHNLVLGALYCPLNNTLDHAENLEARLLHVCSVIELARDLGSSVVGLVAGQIPETNDTRDAQRLRESLQVLFAHGDRFGVQVAVETGLESGKVLGDYLKGFDFGSVGVTLDPANLELHQLDAMDALRELQGSIRLVQAREVKRGGISRASREVALGEGSFDWPMFAMMLAQSGYTGPLIVEREEGDNKAQDVLRGLRYLKGLLDIPLA